MRFENSVTVIPPCSTQSHYKEGYLWESDNRPRDTASLHAVATFGEYNYAPDSDEAAGTIIELADTFCPEYPLNQDVVSSGDIGLLFGRWGKKSVIVKIEFRRNKCTLQRFASHFLKLYLFNKKYPHLGRQQS